MVVTGLVDGLKKAFIIDHRVISPNCAFQKIDPMYLVDIEDMIIFRYRTQVQQRIWEDIMESMSLAQITFSQVKVWQGKNYSWRMSTERKNKSISPRLICRMTLNKAEGRPKIIMNTKPEHLYLEDVM